MIPQRSVSVSSVSSSESEQDLNPEPLSQPKLTSKRPRSSDSNDPISPSGLSPPRKVQLHNVETNKGSKTKRLLEALIEMM